jgi:hypothetical protein
MDTRVRRLGWAITLALATVAAAVLNRLLHDEPGLRRAMVAPEDDEPVTPEDRAALLAARDRIKRGQVVPR